MQSCLTRWNSETFGEIGCNKKRLRARILGIQKALCTKHSRFLVTLERDIIHQYNIILYQEHLLWQMKSRMLWLTYGDANTKFFQLQTKIHRARQHIATFKDDTSEWLHGTQLQTHVTNHFQNLFQMTNPHNTNHSKLWILILIFSKIPLLPSLQLRKFVPPFGVFTLKKLLARMDCMHSSFNILKGL